MLVTSPPGVSDELVSPALLNEQRAEEVCKSGVGTVSGPLMMTLNRNQPFPLLVNPKKESQLYFSKPTGSCYY